MVPASEMAGARANQAGMNPPEADKPGLRTRSQCRDRLHVGPGESAREKRQGNSWVARCVALSLAWVAAVLMAGSAAQAAAPKQQTFAAPEEAVKALVEALKVNDTKSLSAIAGPGSQDLVASGDPLADQARRQHFVRLYEQKNRLQQEGADKVVLHVGPDEWPFPIPLVKQGAAWRFDTAEGKQEILARRIGANELNAIQVCLAYVDAQREYVLKDRDRDGLLEYAQQFMSDPGKKNGLYWQAKAAEGPSPLGPLMAAAQKEGYRRGKPGGRPAPYYGYYYRILKAQGPHAPGGAYDYVVKGKMIGGFALVAYPARYGSSGITTFLVNQDGVVYQKDLGKNTEKLARAMKVFNPDETWKKVEGAAAQAK